jgi:exodeoxyribonuclease V alpha subunit
MLDIHRVFSQYFHEEPLVEEIALALSISLEQGAICRDKNEISSRKLTIPSKYVGVSAEPAKPFVHFNGNLYLHKYFKYETTIIDTICELLSESDQHLEKRIETIQSQKESIQLFFLAHEGQSSAWQFIAALNAYLEKFTIISGGPGTGKTTSIKLFIYLLFHLEPESSIALLAPTGKAAARMNESLLSKSHLAFLNEDVFSEYIESLKASTIHRLLNRRGPQTLKYDCIIIDEASMIDVALMARLFNSIRAKTRLILIGDRSQLSSVEAGSVFGDMSEVFSQYQMGFAESKKTVFDLVKGQSISFDSRAKFLGGRTVELQESHRFTNDSGIGLFAGNILEGKTEILDSLESLDNISVFPDAELENFTEFVLNHYQDQTDKSIEDVLQGLNRVKVLCALKSGPLGSRSINGRIEEILTANKRIKIGPKFYHNQPIMISSNNYELGLFNGDQGIIRETEPGQFQFYFYRSGNELFHLSVELLDHFETSYANTIHKSQGSEYDHIAIIMPDNSDNRILSRQLLYTAITRAKESIALYSSMDVLKSAITKNVSKATGITQRLIDSNGN